MKNISDLSALRRFDAVLPTSLLVVCFFTFSGVSLAATASPQSDPHPIIERLTGTLACETFEDEFFDSLYTVLLRGEKLPSRPIMSKAFEQMLATPRYKTLSAPDLVRAHERLTSLYETVAIETPRLIADGDAQDPRIQLEAISAMEMGDHLTTAKANLHAKIRSQFTALGELFRNLHAKLDCAEATPPAPIGAVDAGALLGGWKKSRAPAVFGALKSLATAYQSCDAGLRPAVSASTPDAQGIKIVGMHPDGIGSRRIVGDLPALLATDPYLSDYRRPAATCFAVDQSPPIYDYGGKPLAATDASNTLDFFKDAGSGTSVLGVDCSGYIYTAFATAGLKVRKSGKLKASGVFGVKAAMWKDPKKNGLDCFDFVNFKAGATIRPGDILASGGHVIMIETAGADPFGVNAFTVEADCRPENMAVERFDFTILQSAPVKGGLGINRIEASHYLTEPGSMHDAILEHAVNACLAHVRGATVASRSEKANLVRHLGTAQCQDKATPLVHEECLASCAAP